MYVLSKCEGLKQKSLLNILKQWGNRQSRSSEQQLRLIVVCQPHIRTRECVFRVEWDKKYLSSEIIQTKTTEEQSKMGKYEESCFKWILFLTTQTSNGIFQFKKLIMVIILLEKPKRTHFSKRESLFPMRGLHIKNERQKRNNNYGNDLVTTLRQLYLRQRWHALLR